MRLKLASTAALATGLVTLVAGHALQLLSPIQVSGSAAVEHAGLSGVVPVLWYVGSLLFALGLLISCIGFCWLCVTFRATKPDKSSGS
jgi:hypothetical protein